MAEGDRKNTRDAFKKVVNMSPAELERWLAHMNWGTAR